MNIHDLPHLNASLNSIALTLLLLGFYFIKQGNRKAHITTMVTALFVSSAFLTSYLIYHAHAEPVIYQGPMRGLYLLILFTHIPCAAIVPLMACKVVWHGAKQSWDQHRKWAKILWPLWIYTSITGIAVYVFLYWV